MKAGVGTVCVHHRNPLSQFSVDALLLSFGVTSHRNKVTNETETYLSVEPEEDDHDEEETRPHRRARHLTHGFRVGDERQAWTYNAKAHVIHCCQISTVVGSHHTGSAGRRDVPRQMAEKSRVKAFQGLCRHLFLVKPQTPWHLIRNP